MSQISQDRSFSGKENITYIRGIEGILLHKLTEYCTEKQYQVITESQIPPSESQFITYYVTLDKLYNLPCLSFLFCKAGTIVSAHGVCDEDEMS